MAESSERRIETSHKLSWRWIESSAASILAANADPITEALRKGHGLLTLGKFVQCLRDGEIEIILLPNRCAALVTFGEVEEGRALTILTVYGKMEHCSFALEALEEAAARSGFNVINSVGHPGWQRLMQQHGYKVIPRIYMQKVLK